MKIVVEEVLEPSRRRVRFRCGAELVEAGWAGIDEPPTGVEVHVEMEIAGTHIISMAPIPVAPGPPLRQDGETVTLAGHLERIDDDDTLIVRVGDDVVLVDGRGLSPGVVAGSNIELTLLDLTLHPTDL